MRLNRFIGIFFFALTGLGLFFSLLSNDRVVAETIVRSSPEDECTRHVFLQIEIYTETDMTDGAMEALAEVWSNQIEVRCNGPTDEAIHQAASEVGMSDEDVVNYAHWNLNPYPSLQKARKKLVDKAKANMEAATGETSCAVINCCKIYFHATVKVRKPGDDESEGYDQVEVQGPEFRSFVSSGFSLENNQEGASGEWGYTPGRSAAAHEAGHLMGIDDFYSDVENEEGESYSKPHEGHESDLMGATNGWPKEEHFTQILKLAGQPCNCCKFEGPDDQYLSGLAVADQFAADALAGNNCEYLGLAKTDLESKLRDLQVQKIDALSKVKTASAIQARLDEIKKALLDCDKPRPMTGIGGNETAITTGNETTGTEGITTAPFSYDSLVCLTYGGGTFELPNSPYFPYGSNLPIFPIGPVQGPASVPQDTRPPEITPGPVDTRPPATTAPPPEKPVKVDEGAATDTQGKDIVVPPPTQVDLTPGAEDSVVQRSTEPGTGEPGAKDEVQTEMLEMNLTGGGIVIPFNKLEYDQNKNQIRTENEGEITTPFDLPNLFSGTKEEQPPELIIKVTPRIVSEEDEGGGTTVTPAPEQGKVNEIERTETVYDPTGRVVGTTENTWKGN